MGRSFASRALPALCAALALLLTALAAVQYRWSTRVAAADVQREKEHLESAAALFASQFNSLAAQAMIFLQNDARAALQSGQPFKPLPKLIGELYFLDFAAAGGPRAQRLNSDGRLTPASIPAWLTIPTCASMVVDQPPALVAPVFELATRPHPRAEGVLRTFRWRPDRCFVARLDEAYLRGSLFPQLIRQSFGPTSVSEYAFSVVPRNRPRDLLYGTPLRADLSKTFFAISLTAPPLARPDAPPPGNAVYVQHVEVIRKGAAPMADLFGAGIWQLDIAHRGIPLAAAFEQTRRRDLFLSLAVEALLLAGVLFLVLGARRMQRLADQKMRFVAGVSHELRTPVSAISMLSRNQADGLVSGPERVKQYGELIHQQTRRLNEMVEQTLQYAGIHSGLRRPASQAIDVRRLIEDAVESRRADWTAAGFQVEMALPSDLPPVSGDPGLLRLALDGLLGNVEKHAGAGRWVRIAAVHSAPEREVRISVEDHGTGIDPADQAEIFEPFSRGRAALEAQIPGSGLGLALVRSAAEAHRGSVSLVSQPGRGSTFTLHLPV